MKRFPARPGWALLTSLIMVVLIQAIFIERCACYAGPPQGNTYVDVRKLTKRDAKRIDKTLIHPFELSDDIAAKILSSIYYKEKGLFKFKKNRLAVFTNAEVRTLAPLVADAFARAEDNDYVVVYSTVSRILLSDLHTYCMLFITDSMTREGPVNELNIAFTAIQHKVSYNITESEKARIEKLFAKPVDIKKSAFWRLAPIEGQRLKEEHRNWLILDLDAVSVPQTPPSWGEVRAEAFPKGRPDEQAPPNTAYELASPPTRRYNLEERVRRLEEKTHAGSTKRSRRAPQTREEDAYIRVDMAKDYAPESPTYPPEHNPQTGWTAEENARDAREEFRNLGIKEKLKKLRVLRDEGLITEDDYRSKKSKLIKQDQKNKSVREKLKELRDMRDEGLITSKDYDSLKKELLDKWF